MLLFLPSVGYTALVPVLIFVLIAPGTIPVAGICIGVLILLPIFYMSRHVKKSIHKGSANRETANAETSAKQSLIRLYNWQILFVLAAVLVFTVFTFWMFKKSPSYSQLAEAIEADGILNVLPIYRKTLQHIVAQAAPVGEQSDEKAFVGIAYLFCIGIYLLTAIQSVIFSYLFCPLQNVRSRIYPMAKLSNRVAIPGIQAWTIIGALALTAFAIFGGSGGGFRRDFLQAFFVGPEIVQVLVFEITMIAGLYFFVVAIIFSRID